MVNRGKDRGRGTNQHRVNDGERGKAIVGKSLSFYRDAPRALLNRKRREDGRCGGNDGSILLYNVRLPITVLRNDV